MLARLPARFFKSAILIAALAMACLSGAWAAGVNVTQNLDFGQWFVANNGGSYTVTVTAAGGTSHSGGVTQLRGARPGIYVITGLPADTAINGIMVTQSQALATGGGETMTMDTFDVINDPVTDGAGNLNVRVGATARTSGSGTGYAPGDYQGNLLLEFDINL